MTTAYKLRVTSNGHQPDRLVNNGSLPTGIECQLGQLADFVQRSGLVVLALQDRDCISLYILILVSARMLDLADQGRGRGKKPCSGQPAKPTEMTSRRQDMPRSMIQKANLL